jgi:type IV pilus assembly protein PilV
MRTRADSAQRGTSLVEVLVAMVILAVGLLGLVGLHARLQILQAESYQRAQALMLLDDLASRVALNRNNAVAYVTDPDTPLGTDGDCPDPGVTRQEADESEWCSSLIGAGETKGGLNVGAMVGGLGCVEQLGGSNRFMVTVAWQGLAPLTAPPETVTCGQGAYDGADGSPCTGDVCRRVVTTIVEIATL